jgi:clathrin heavy chain
LSVSIDEANIIPYIMNTLQNLDLAIRLASRNGLPGADDIYVTRFNQLFSTGNFAEAAKVAATSPRVGAHFRIRSCRSCFCPSIFQSVC